MRSVILSVMVSLDGFFESPGDEATKLDWHRADDEWDAYGVELLQGADTLLLGRRTYAGFAQFWPTQEGELARLLNAIPKVVFSTTLTEVLWESSRLVREHAPEVVAQLKAAPGKDILLFASANLAATLMRHGLIDEYRVAVNPVVLNAGTPLFKGGGDHLNLRLIGTRTFASGIVELRHTPEWERPDATDRTGTV